MTRVTSTTGSRRGCARDAVKGRVRRLQAVTVCINYADYLECVVENARHFDRWIVISVPDDKDTARLCRKHGLDCRQSRTLKSDGSDFDAAYNKSSVVNEALDLLDPQGWALIVDADVRLPRYFRERVAGLPLESGALYGMSGRKICGERGMFEALLEAEPWERYCARHSGIFGYINLFDLEHPLNRYLPSQSRAQHDDNRFQERFPLSHRRMLPMTVLHTGLQCENWHRRRTPAFIGTPRSAREDESPPISSGRAAFVGYFPGMRAIKWLARFARVDLVDEFSIHAGSGAELIEADRTVLRRLWRRQTMAMRHLHRLGAHSAKSLERIPDESVDYLHLAGEVGPEWLVEALPLWLPKLKDGAFVAGDLFSPWHWPDSTYAISLLLGVPDHVSVSGAWWTRFRRSGPTGISTYPSKLPVRVDAGVGAGANGVIFVIGRSGLLERLLLSLHSLRQHWRGATTVFHWGVTDHSLAILCARYGVRLEHVGDGSALSTRRDADLVREALEMSPFTRALFAPAGTLFLGDPSSLFQREQRSCARVSAQRPQLHSRHAGEPTCRAPRFVSAVAFNSVPDVSPLLVCAGSPAQWSSAAWDAWRANEAEMTRALACSVRIPPRSLILTVVDRASASTFGRNWTAWRFRGEPPVWVALDQVPAGDLSFPANHRPSNVLPLAGGGDPRLVADLRAADVDHIILLPATAIPLPGADLLAAERWPRSTMYLHKSPDALFAIAERECFAQALSEASGARSRVPFCTRLRSALVKQPARVHLFDASRLGWRWAGQHS